MTWIFTEPLSGSQELAIVILAACAVGILFYLLAPNYRARLTTLDDPAIQQQRADYQAQLEADARERQVFAAINATRPLSQSAAKGFHRPSSVVVPFDASTGRKVS